MVSMETLGLTLAFMVADVLTGLVKAWRAHDVKSSAMREGLYHKIGYIGVIFLAQGIEVAADNVPGITIAVPITAGICAFIILSETVSIMENLAAINPAIRAVFDRFPVHPDGEPTVGDEDAPAQPEAGDEHTPSTDEHTPTQ